MESVLRRFKSKGNRPGCIQLSSDNNSIPIFFTLIVEIDYHRLTRVSIGVNNLDLGYTHSRHRYNGKKTRNIRQ